MANAGDETTDEIRAAVFAMYAHLRKLTLEDRLLAINVLLLATGIPNGVTIDALCERLRDLHERSFFHGLPPS